MRNYPIAPLLTLIALTKQLDITELRLTHKPLELAKPQVRYLAKLANSTHTNEILDNICIPRVVGTKSHDSVHDYIVSQMTDLGWDVEVDSFNERTPNFGVLNFRNIIATLNPDAERFLVLACHYDSKYFKGLEFVGATDSAVPCAMMMNLAFLLKNELLRYKSNPELSLQFIFFDGEEAFLSWGPKDSIYGARHLANKLEQSRKVRQSSVSDIERIDVLVLLDLIGTRDPTFYSYFRDTYRWVFKLGDIERRLADQNLLERYSRYRHKYFELTNYNAHIEDDHIPFLIRGVPILHLIPTPFPNVWHTLKDDRNVVDLATVENLNKILRVFVAEYLHLSVSPGR